MNRQLLNKEEVRVIMLHILKEIKEYCEKEKITFFLTGGTLLGAVRHKGFIPWDDDIDIAMFRNDYEKFLKEFTSKSGTIEILSPYSSNQYRYAHAKAIDNTTIVIEGEDETFPIGVYVDVFPIDSLSDELQQCKKIMNRQHKWQLLHQLKYLHINKKRGWIKNGCLLFLRPVLRLIPDEWFWEKKEKAIKKKHVRCRFRPF